MADEELNRLLSQKPTNGTLQELEAWRNEVRAARAQSEKEFDHWLKKISEQWQPEEWQAMREQLEKLSLKELQTLADTVGITFSYGNKTVADKEELISVLDEAERDELQKAYEGIVKSRG